MDFREIVIPDKIKAVITPELIEVLEEAPCTCKNPDPGDWPHDPENTECYRRRLIDTLTLFGTK